MGWKARPFYRMTYWCLCLPLSLRVRFAPPPWVSFGQIHLVCECSAVVYAICGKNTQSSIGVPNGIGGRSVAFRDEDRSQRHRTSLNILHGQTKACRKVFLVNFPTSHLAHTCGACDACDVKYEDRAHSSKHIFYNRQSPPTNNSMARRISAANDDEMLPWPRITTV